MQRLRNVFVVALMVVGFKAQAQDAAALRMVQTIPLSNVEGRIDHMAVDPKGQRLFIAALGNNTVEIVDLSANKRIRSIAGFHEPQGVGFVPEFNKLFVANAKTGTCDIFDASAFKLAKTVKFPDDADNIRYDAKARRIYVGYGSGALGIIEPATGGQLSTIALDGHPESFQLEKSGSRIFVNIPTAQKIVVVDRERKAVLTAWSFPSAQANYPMALDEMHHRLFVGFRKPARLVVFDTGSGKVVADISSPGDADDIFYDAKRQRIYISGGEGFIGVVQQRDSDRYIATTKIRTAAGARTSLYVPELGSLYLAVPHRSGQNAEVRVFEARP